MNRKRIRSHTPSIGVGGSTPGPPSGGNQGLLITDLFNTLKVLQSETVTQSTAETFNLTVNSTETNSTPTTNDTLSVSGSGLNETNGSQSDTRNSQLRCWAVTSSDNDSSKTTPTNANLANNSTFATIKTNLSLGDVTNPVVLTSSGFATPGTGTFSSKIIRVYFNIPARTTSLDTGIFLAYNVGAGDVHIYDHTGTAAVNHNTGDFTFDVSALSLAQLSTIQLKASYQATVVAAPETVINLDAWAIELVGGI